ncbi:DUF6587 family protein [Pseudoxanthomonas wuyuanensis]|uniref:Uncharacterized protein n=1 Tax=Pseudoxanthomonas wuyuanensis TaxID=1073196 RepID=A0A286CWC8_9GAMM|nr:DUF6587 family protein [Pseudoxanthomonas wuyuanensis]KAF1719138.1 hypothetical protein CSC75_16290 [Pseudoxanthomonas wuyuanensis]SOD50695.1 hypothetical protein SAMN06296416_101282 [Pseudoxanthomonas wuyuanensis]
MDTGLLLQYLVIAAAVLISAWVVANKQFPGGMRKLRIALALRLLREGRAEWLRAIGRRIAPPGRAADAACGGCNNCDPPAAGR